MRIPLSEFEQMIDETILKRGLSYFKKGLVSAPEEITTDQFECMVQGTDEYTISFNLKNGVMSNPACTCPYDFGPVCKHIAAVCFYLQQDELGITAKQPAQKQKQAKQKHPNNAKPKTVAEKIEYTLAKLSHDELSDFIRRQCARNTSFRQTFLSDYAHLLEEESIQFYRKQIKAILSSGKERGGFIGYYSANKVGKEIAYLLDNAKECIAAANYYSVSFICFAVLVEVTSALNYADDSSGILGGNIETALDFLQQLASLHDTSTSQLLYATALDFFDKKYLEEWDWHVNLLWLAKSAATRPEQFQEIRNRLKSLSHSEYYYKEGQKIELDIIRQTKGEDAALDYMINNCSNPDFRKKYLEYLINTKQYAAAKQIAKEGLVNDKDFAGLQLDWLEWLFKIAMEEKNETDVLLLARELYFEAYARNNTDYYEILKKTVPANEWSNYVAGLISEWKKRARWSYADHIAKIYIREKQWNHLLELVGADPQLHFIERYEKYLSGTYAKQLAVFYETAILEFLKDNISRSNYKHACQYIKRIIRLGEQEIAQRLVTKLRHQYPQRRALIDELNVFGN